MATEKTDQITLYLQVCPAGGGAERAREAISLQECLRDVGLDARPAAAQTAAPGSKGELLEFGRLLLDIASASESWLALSSAAAGALAAWLKANPRRQTIIKRGDQEYRLNGDMSADDIVEFLRRLKELD